MPSLINNQGNLTDVAANYRRALDNFSRFGTRKLAFYTVWIYGVDDITRDQLYYDEETADDQFPTEWIEAPGSILEAAQRGIQLVAEPYFYGDWDTNEEGPNYTDVYFTFAVAADTVLDGAAQSDSPYVQNPHAYSIENAILDSISNFQNDGVYVQQAIIRGDYIDEQGSDALGRKNPANAQRAINKKASLTAAGKPPVKLSR